MPVVAVSQTYDSFINDSVGGSSRWLSSSVLPAIYLCWRNQSLLTNFQKLSTVCRNGQLIWLVGHFEKAAFSG